MNNEITNLRRRVAALEQENETLRAKVTFFDYSPWMRDGIRGEQVVAKLIGGTMTAVNERFDVLTQSTRVRLEVKYSKLNIARAGVITQRWTWAHLLGYDRSKSFDSLILLGVADSRYKHLYRDTASPFVLFDVPFRSLSKIVRGTSQRVQISTNPLKAHTDVAKALFGRFQVTRHELRSKYRIA